MGDEGKGPVRILIADDHELLRSGLRHLLETNPNFVVISEASDGAQTLAKARRLKPDVLLLDLSMPNVSGLEVLRELGKSENLRTILLTAAIEKSQMDEAVGLGARGVILKSSLTKHIFQAVHAVVAGDIWLVNKATKEPTAQKKSTKHHGNTK
jgi:two-component system nitrate/nitrite response regulator NarL